MLCDQVRQIMAETSRIHPEAKAALEARLVAILDVVMGCTTPTSVNVISVPEQENAIGLQIQLVPPPGQQRPLILSVITRYRLAGTERDLLEADTTILLFDGASPSDRQTLHHAGAAERIHRYLRTVIGVARESE